MANFQFNAQGIDTSGANDFGVIPAGTYNAAIIDSDFKPLKSGKGMGLSLQFRILDGQYANRRVFANLNVQHENDQAQSIAQRDLALLCKAINTPTFTDTQQLHNKPLKIRVKIRKDEAYGDKNEVAGYEAAGAGAAIPTMVAQQAAAPASRPAPWAAAKAAA